MMDLSKLTDAELEKIAKQPASQDLSHLSDSELEKLAGADAPVTDEMHPGLTFKDRLLVKTFGNDPKSTVKYLQKEHPELEIKTGKDGEVLARAKGETSYRVLDPSGLDLQDVTDVAGDVVQGGLSSLAALGGGLAGNLPGAVAAGAASNAGLEAMRQKIGQALGINDDFSKLGVAAAGIGGAAGPLLFGAGKAAPSILTKLASKPAEAAVTGAAEAALPAASEGMKRVFDPFTKQTVEVALPTARKVFDPFTKETVERAVETAAPKAAETAASQTNVLADAIKQVGLDLAKRATGGGIGYHLGGEVGEALGGHKGKAIGKAVGGGLGAMAVSPTALKAYAKSAEGALALQELLRQTSLPGVMTVAPQSAWDALMTRQMQGQ